MASGIDNITTGAMYPGAYSTGLSSATTPFFDFLLRNQIIPAVIDGRNNEVPLLGLLYKRVKKVSGKFIVQPVRDGRNWAGISSIAPEGYMPDPGQQGAYVYSLPTRNIYARAKFSGKLLRAASGGDLIAMAEPIAYETKGLMQDLAIKQEYMLHSDGSGRRAEAASTAAGSITVRLNQDHIGIATVTTAPTAYLAVGMRIAFVTAAGTVRGSTAYYVASIPSSSTITVSATLGGSAVLDHTALSISAGDWIVDASRDTSTANTDVAWKAEPMGLMGVMRDTGVLDGNAVSVAGQQTGAQDFSLTSTTASACGFQGVPVNGTPTNYNYAAPTWNKAVIASGGGALRNISDGLIQRAVSDSRRLNNAQTKMLLSSWGTYDSYVDTIIGDKRFNTNTLTGGHDGDGQIGGVTWSGMQWFKSRFYLDNMLTGIDPDMFSIYENEPLSVCAPPGNPQFERLHDKDQFWCAFVTEYNLFCELRQRAGFHLTDIQ